MQDKIEYQATKLKLQVMGGGSVRELTYT